MAKSVGKISKVFTKVIHDLVESNSAISDSLRGAGRRQWQAPKVAGWNGNPLDIPGMVKPFDRDDLNANYEEAIASGSEPGTIGDVVAIKTQIDYVACIERAFRASRATPVRCLTHAASRRAGHGQDRGPIQSVARYVQDTLKAGQTE